MKKINYYLLSTVLLVSLSSLALNFKSVSFNETSNLDNDEIISVNTSKSSVSWKGEKVTGFHEGVINIKSANLTFNNNELSGGEVTIDMSTINCTDLSGPYKNKLEKHQVFQALEAMRAQYPQGALVIQADGEASAEMMAHVIDAAKRAGITDISLAAVQ